MRGRITGTGSCLPEKVLTNDDLSKMVDTSDEWISTRTGIRSRRIAVGETTASMAAAAAEAALENAGCLAGEIELIIVATSTQDFSFPNCASAVQAEIGAASAACMDISLACSGFIAALHTADAFIRAGIYRKALVIGSERMSSILDWKDRSVCVLFGDGAGACVLEADCGDSGILDTDLHSDGSKGMVLTGGARDMPNIKMNGQEVFKFAVRKVPESIGCLIERNGLTANDIEGFLLHQANVRIIESVARRMQADICKFPMNMMSYGNTSAASIPILLDEMNRKNKLSAGKFYVLSGFGAGLSWGSVLLRW